MGLKSVMTVEVRHRVRECYGIVLKHNDGWSVVYVDITLGFNFDVTAFAFLLIMLILRDSAFVDVGIRATPCRVTILFWPVKTQRC